MKKLTYISLLLCGLTSSAQGIIVNQEGFDLGIQTNSQQVNLLNEQTSFQNNETFVSSETIFINQIGNTNRVDLHTKSNATDVEIIQRGLNNQADLSLQANRIDYSLLQNGNNNLLMEFNVNPDTELLQRSVEQNGNGQNLIIHGQNRLVDKMKINMQGSQTIILRNTN